MRQRRVWPMGTEHRPHQPLEEEDIAAHTSRVTAPAAPPDLIDIGVNLTNKSFRGDLDAVVERARHAGVVHMVVTGTTVEASGAARALAAGRPELLSATAGVHPHHASSCDHDTIAALRALAAEPVVRAVGECGLDYNRNYSPPEAQRRWFAAQVELAVELGMPLFLHQRDAHEDFLAIVGDAPVPAVVHCFTGSDAELDDYLARGFFIGITGWINDERRGQDLAAAAPRIPADRLMIETDAPYLLPRDMPSPPKNRRNEPAFLPFVLERLASVRGCAPAEVATGTTAVARAFFGIG